VSVSHFSMMPTFYEEYESGAYAGYYRPQNAIVLSSPQTYSSGFTFMLFLYHMGATLVGTPSAQPPNGTGSALTFQPKNTYPAQHPSGMLMWRSTINFPEDPDMRVLPVDFPMTYEKLASYDFDPNAEVLYALELIPGLEGAAQREPLGSSAAEMIEPIAVAQSSGGGEQVYSNILRE
jgi:hypothetical protein